MEEHIRLVTKPHIMSRRRWRTEIIGEQAADVKIYCTSFETRIGSVYIASTEKGVCKISIPRESKKEFIKWIKQYFDYDAVVENKSRNKETIDQVSRYFNGKLVSFTCDIDLRGTPFQLRVWKEISKIPYGTVSAYKQIAKKVGVHSGYQAVGRAVGLNPLPIIIPCHRVMGTDGSLTGYAGGIKTKEFLLRLEGALLI
jgi:O-6-methylguanine DNA methyltransferase